MTSGTPKLSMSSSMCKTRCVLIVVFPIPPDSLGATNFSERINEDTASPDRDADRREIRLCFSQACHSRRELKNILQSLTKLGLLRDMSASTSVAVGGGGGSAPTPAVGEDGGCKDFAFDAFLPFFFRFDFLADLKISAK